MEKYSNVDYYGKVRLRDSQNKFEYGLFDNRFAEIQYVDIEEMLNNVYMKSPKYKLCVTITVLKSGYDMKDTEVIFKSDGELFKKKVYGSYEWHIGDLESEYGECLGDALFETVGKKIMFSMEVYS